MDNQMQSLVIMNCLDWIISPQGALVLSWVGASVSFISQRWAANHKNQLSKDCEKYKSELQNQLSKDCEKYKSDLQLALSRAEFKAKNLLEIYPQLLQALRKNGVLPIFFNVLKKHFQETTPSTADECKQLLFTVLLAYPEANKFGLEQCSEFVDCYEKSTLFISDEVDAIVSEAKDLLENLTASTRLFIEKQANNCSVTTMKIFIDQGITLSSDLKKCKEKMQKQMNQELHPERR